ncbi:MAG: hypothetical protein Q7J68_03820 [Thermoplasmata archaeon]|nr:hypothetical protein [Thermoplasmata archaeon]
MMALPKGTFKGLARVILPFSFWMAAGWYAYPYMIEKISDSMNEVIDMAEVELFSTIMVVFCIIAGIGLAIYGFTGQDPKDADIKILGKPELLCPYCGKALTIDVTKCAGCGKSIPK